MSLQIAACPNHPQREAIGVCVRCRSRVCGECATKVDGINYCVSCLAQVAGEQARGRSTRAPLRAAYLSASTYFIVLSVLVWALLRVMTDAGLPR